MYSVAHTQVGKRNLRSPTREGQKHRFAPANEWIAIPLASVSLNDPICDTARGKAYSQVTYSVEASANAPDGAFFRKNLHLGGAVSKTLKVGFLPHARIRTLLKWGHLSTRRSHAGSQLTPFRQRLQCHDAWRFMPLPHCLLTCPPVQLSAPGDVRCAGCQIAFRCFGGVDLCVQR